MRFKRFDWDGSEPVAIAEEIRALQPALGEVSESVRAIIEEVRSGGDEAVAAIESRFGGREIAPDSFRVPDDALGAAASRLEPDLVAALDTAAANIRAVAEAQLAEDRNLELRQGQSIELREVAGCVRRASMRRAAAAAYPSTVLMGCIPANAAGVRRIALATPPGPGPQAVSDVILAAAAIGGADEVYAIGGAQAIAALALGTERIEPVDVIAGPGNRYVQEAKRQLVGDVGIDGIAGPSELMVIAGDTADAEWIALDLCAQAEHGPDGLLVAAAVETVILDEIQNAVAELAADRGIAAESTMAIVQVPDTGAGVLLANAIAPEHLEILTEDADLLAGAVTTAGCVFVGERSATAFGDYAAGSNHVLPTGGAGRFQGPLGPGRLQAPDHDRRDDAGGGPGAGPDGRYIGPRRGLPAARRLRRGEEQRTRGMSRTAEISRETRETKVSLRLDLDGGEAKISTGVGFLDHMLELLARHGRLGLELEATGDLRDRRAPHDRGRRDLPRAGDRRGAGRPRRDPPLRLGARADGRGAGRVRDRHLGQAVLRLRRGASRRDDRRLRLGADRGVLPRGLQQLEDDAAPLGPLRLERPPHDRGLLQGVRPRPARGRLDRPRTRAGCRPPRGR